MKIDILKLRASSIPEIEKEIDTVDKELELDTLMNPLSYARYKDLCDYKAELLQEIANRKNNQLKQCHKNIGELKMADKRYIDAAVAADVISDRLNVPLSDLVDVFAEIPAVDVKHGEWIEHKLLTAPRYECSACGIYRSERTSYCPICGARMAVLEQLKAEIERLKQENESLRQNSVSHSVYEMLLGENRKLEQ